MTAPAPTSTGSSPPPMSLAEKFSHDLANYARLPTKTYESRFSETIDDLSLRLDEFQHLLEMNKKDSKRCLYQQLPELVKKYKEMEVVFQQVDKLDVTVGRVKADVDRLEKRLVEAESTVEGAQPTPNPSDLRSFIPVALFGPRANASAQQDSSRQDRIDVFTAKDFFKSS